LTFTAASIWCAAWLLGCPTPCRLPGRPSPSQRKLGRRFAGWRRRARPHGLLGLRRAALPVLRRDEVGRRVLWRERSAGSGSLRWQHGSAFRSPPLADSHDSDRTRNATGRTPIAHLMYLIRIRYIMEYLYLQLDQTFGRIYWQIQSALVPKWLAQAAKMVLDLLRPRHSYCRHLLTLQ
jgi:hypothetical protein